MEQFELITTKDGSLTLRDPGFDEAFHSFEGALFEAKSLYIEASGFAPAQVLKDQAVFDVGLGLGYNALSTIEAWFAVPRAKNLKIDSIEFNPALVEALISGQASWQADWSPDWKAWAGSLKEVSPGHYQAALRHPGGASCTWNLHRGRFDAQMLEALRVEQPWSFIWQDAFSPTKNPELWTADWFEAVAGKSRSDVCLMTYSVARAVRDALSAAGWHPAKIKALGRTKKSWLQARLVPLENLLSDQPTDREVKN